MVQVSVYLIPAASGPRYDAPVTVGSASGKPPAYVLVITWPITVTGGVNEVVFALAHQLRSFGWRPLVACATWSHSPQPTEWRGIEIVNLQLRDLEGVKTWKSWAAYPIAGLRDAVALRRFLHKENVAVLNFHFATAAALIPALLSSARLLGVKLLMSFHGNDYVDLSKASGWRLKAWRYMLRHCHAITACSDVLRDNIMRLLPRIIVQTVHNGVDSHLFNVPRTEGKTRPCILQIAKFEDKKAQDIMLAAFRRLLDEGMGADLLLVGSTGPELEATRLLIQQLGLVHRVTMEVDLPHERIPALMATADVLALPSRKEGLPLVLLEAGAACLPIVTTPVGGIPEMLTDGETALLVPVDDVDALAAALRRMLTEPDLAARLAQTWNSKVKARWTWEQTACGYLAALGLL